MPFDIGFVELCVLLIVGLMVIGPDKLPVAARQLSKWFGGIRRHVNSFKSEVGRELEMDELRRQVESQKEALDQVASRADSQVHISKRQDERSEKRESQQSEPKGALSTPKN